ncbi:MAG: hypothetical protein ACYS91_19065, partial [Planctomycetota bacterium]
LLGSTGKAQSILRNIIETIVMTRCLLSIGEQYDFSIGKSPIYEQTAGSLRKVIMIIRNKKSKMQKVLYKHISSWIPAYWVPVYNIQGFGLSEIA